MRGFRLLSATEQVAGHLREGLQSRRWVDFMPGINRQAAELGVNNKTVELALARLGEEGLLEGQGAGRRRRITGAAVAESGRKQLRVRILLFEEVDRRSASNLEILHQLRAAGHDTDFAGSTLTGLAMNPQRIAKLVKKAAADAWLVIAATRKVSQWFAAQPLPVYALFGSRTGIDVAGGGVNRVSALQAVARRLVGLGHSRIVLLTRSNRRHPRPTQQIRVFLNKLRALGVSIGPYNLPDWEETVDGYHQCLESLFQVTPPTALVIDGTPLVIAAQQFLMSRGLRVPEDVSIVGTDPNPAFDWCRQAMSHIHWEPRRLLPSIIRWADSAAQGRKTTHQTLTMGRFIEGATIGPVASQA